MLKSESMPTRRSGRLQMRQHSADSERDKPIELVKDIPFKVSSNVQVVNDEHIRTAFTNCNIQLLCFLQNRSKGSNAKQPSLDDEVDTILGATSSPDGELKFCILLKDKEVPVLITSHEAKQKYPYHVLDFYESCLVWESEESEEDNVNDTDESKNAGDNATDEDKPLSHLKSKD